MGQQPVKTRVGVLTKWFNHSYIKACGTQPVDSDRLLQYGSVWVRRGQDVLKQSSWDEVQQAR